MLDDTAASELNTHPLLDLWFSFSPLRFFQFRMTLFSFLAAHQVDVVHFGFCFEAGQGQRLDDIFHTSPLREGRL